MLEEQVVDSDKVQMEDAFCENHWRYVSWVLTERIGSNLSHTVLYPMCLGGLNGDDSQKAATLAKLKRDNDSLIALLACNLACAQSAARRHTLNTPAMSQTARMAQRSDFQMSPELVNRGRHFFRDR